MSEVFGLFSNTLVAFDDKRLCLSLLGSATHQLLRIPKEQYSIKGNTISFQRGCNLSEEEIKTLIESRITYRLLQAPEANIENKIHSYTMEVDTDFNYLLRNLFVLTFILDGIPGLPDLHYPSLQNSKKLRISDAVLDKECLRKILFRMRGIKRVRLLSSDILASDTLLLPELEDKSVETIVDQDYYLTYRDRFQSFPKKIRLLVYLEDIARANEITRMPPLEHVDVSYFCPIKRPEDLSRFKKLAIHATPFPASGASAKLLHTVLDYSAEDILQTTVSRQDLLLKQNINPLFYGSIIVDNNGCLHSFPLIEETNKRHDIGETLKQMRANTFWHLKRSDFFEKCRNCALLDLCPPLTPYEINLRQTFCKE